MIASERLNVYLFNSFAGHLWLDAAGRFSFQYDAGYLTDPVSVSLSLSLPLREEPYIHDEAKPFFSNLLPEGEIRSLITKIKQISEQNDFKLLEAIGGECAGAVSLLPEYATPGAKGDYIPLSEQEVENILQENTVRPALIVRDEMRLSLAGAQNKIPVYCDAGRLFLTSGVAPSSHILKPQSAHFVDMVQNEYFCMRLAEAVYLPVPRFFIWKGKNRIAYIIERYDRIKSKNGTIERLHQEDFCQALGRRPDQKYENEGGPTLLECCRMIERSSSQPVLDKQALAMWVIFNYFIGNADAHAKNLSLLWGKNGAIRLAPFYDLLSTGVYPEIVQKMAMKIGNEARFSWVMERHWRQMADHLDIKFAYLKHLLKNLAEAIDAAMMKTADAISSEYNGQKTIQKICEIINIHIRRIRGIL